MTRYYDLDAANARIAEIRPLLERLRSDRDAVAEAQRDLVRFRQTNGNQQFSEELEERERRIRTIVQEMRSSVLQLDAWSVTLRDIGTGLIDLPALSNGRPIWLCWKLGEGAIDWWHELDAGLAGRKRLADLT